MTHTYPYLRVFMYSTLDTWVCVNIFIILLISQVAELYELVKKWHAVAEQLPALSDRLHALEEAVERSAAFASRLSSLDEEHARLADLLASNSKLVDSVHIYALTFSRALYEYF